MARGVESPAGISLSAGIKMLLAWLFVSYFTRSCQFLLLSPGSLTIYASPPLIQRMSGAYSRRNSGELNILLIVSRPESASAWALTEKDMPVSKT